MVPSAPASPADTDRLLVVATPAHALEMLRLAILRSDDVQFLAEIVPPAAQRFARQFAVEVVSRAFRAEDLAGVSAVLVALDDAEDENRVVRSARRKSVPVHVHNRPLVSDFSVLAMLEGQTSRLDAA